MGMHTLATLVCQSVKLGGKYKKNIGNRVGRFNIDHYEGGGTYKKTARECGPKVFSCAFATIYQPCKWEGIMHT